MAIPKIDHIEPYKGSITGIKNKYTVKPWDESWIDPDSVTRLLPIPFPHPPSSFISGEPHAPINPIDHGEPALDATIRDNIWLSDALAKAPVDVTSFLQKASDNLSKWEATNVDSQVDIVNGRISGSKLDKVIKVSGASLYKEIAANESENVVSILDNIHDSAKSDMTKYALLVSSSLGKIKTLNAVIDNTPVNNTRAVVSDINNLLLRALDNVPLAEARRDISAYVDKMEKFKGSLSEAMLKLPREYVVTNKVSKVIEEALSPIVKSKEYLAVHVDEFTELELVIPLVTIDSDLELSSDAVDAIIGSV